MRPFFCTTGRISFQPFELEHAILDTTVRYQPIAASIRRSFERFVEADGITLSHDFLWHFR